MKASARPTADASTAAPEIRIQAVTAPPPLIPTPLGTLLFDLLLLLLLTGGVVGSLITGFSLAVYPSVLLAFIPLLCLIGRILLHGSRRLPLLSLSYPLILALWLWLRRDMLVQGAGYAAAAIFRLLCWGFPALTMPDALSEFDQVLQHAGTNDLLLTAVVRPYMTEILLYAAALLILLWTLLYRRCHTVWIPAFLPLPSFVLCLMIVESTLPDLWALLLVLLYWALLLLTRSASRLHARAASAQAACLVLPCTLFLIAMYLWYPSETPVGTLVQTGYDRVLNVLSAIETTVSNAAGSVFSGGWFNVSAEGDTISFDNLGPRKYLGRTVMRAKCDTTGVVYLRENAYGTYTPGGWEQTVYDDTVYPDVIPDILRVSASVLSDSGVRPSRLSLDGARSDLLFTPYYFSDADINYAFDGDSRITNPGRLSDYDVSFYRFSGNFDDLVYDTSTASLAYTMMTQTYLRDTVPVYLEIDRSLAAELRSILADAAITPPDSFEQTFVFDENGSIRTVMDYDTMWDTVADITLFVRSSADYSLNADRNTTDRDFVLWFLEDAEYGYCTHFATAEVMLLRACGIPARLASGFIGSIHEAGRWTAIKDSNAHAWAEVFDARLGWIPVEATPPSELSDDMDADDVIVGMMPIPGEETTAPEPSLPEQTETTEIPAETADITEPADTVSAAAPADTEHVPDTDDPSGGGGTGGESGTGSGGMGTSMLSAKLLHTFAAVLSVLLCMAALVLLMLFYRSARKRSLEALLYPEAAHRNASALRLYRRCAALASACGEALPAALTTAAEKARFSRHTLTEAEHDQFRVWYQAHCAVLQEHDKPMSRLRHYWFDVYY